MWNFKQIAECKKAMASFLSELDDIIRKITAKDRVIVTTVLTEKEQKAYNSGKVIAIKRSLDQ